jgi:hypothetical protein
VPILVAAAALATGYVGAAKLIDLVVAEQIKQRNKEQVEHITRLQETILLPLCLEGKAEACNKLVELEEVKRRCQVAAAAASAEQSNVPGGSMQRPLTKIPDVRNPLPK